MIRGKCRDRVRTKAVDVYQIGMRREATGNSKMRARTKARDRGRGLRKDKGKKDENGKDVIVVRGRGRGLKKDKGKRMKDEIGKLP